MGSRPAESDAEAAWEIACLILADPPVWLVKAIEIAVLPRLRKEIGGFKAYPRRAELRPKINETDDAIERLGTNLRDRGVWSQIVANLPAGDPSRQLLIRFAEAITNDGLHIRAALARAKENVREGKGGRVAALSPTAPKPGAVCAALVAIAWAEAHGSKVPGNYDRRLWAACAALWRAAGGDSRLSRAEGGGWRLHLRAVADIPPALLSRYRKPFQNVRRLVERGLLAPPPRPPIT
jgi:hypothetical protein